jgi:hypothetical protein
MRINGGGLMVTTAPNLDLKVESAVSTANKIGSPHFNTSGTTLTLSGSKKNLIRTNLGTPESPTTFLKRQQSLSPNQDLIDMCIQDS